MCIMFLFDGTQTEPNLYVFIGPGSYKSVTYTVDTACHLLKKMLLDLFELQNIFLHLGVFYGSRSQTSNRLFSDLYHNHQTYLH